MTIPLLMMVSELNRRQRELIHIISKKDLEIEDYRAQSVKLNQSKSFQIFFVILIAITASFYTERRKQGATDSL